MPNQRIRKGMAFVPQGQQSFGTMTVDENLHVVADRYGSEAKARYDEAVTMFPVLKECAYNRALKTRRYKAFSSVNRYTCEF